MLKTARFTSKGFTMVELLIVVSIIAIMTGALVPSFSAYTKNQALRQAQEQIVNDLYNVQNNALSGKKNFDGSLTAYWGLRFTNSGDYEYISSTDTTCTPTSGTSERDVALPTDMMVVVPTPPDCVFFSNKNGDSPTSKTVKVKSNTGTGCYKITINEAGLISRVKEFDPSCL